MKEEKELIKLDDVSNMIYEIRGEKVMFDFDLARLYGYEVKQLNRQVKRNSVRFPYDFMFQLEQKELDDLRCQKGTIIKEKDLFKRLKQTKYRPYVFTEEGIYMLSAVLNNFIAIKQSILIMRAFKAMRHYLENTKNKEIQTETLSIREIKDSNISFKIIYNELPKEKDKLEKIFFNGETYEAFECIRNIIKEASMEIILIDNYVDGETLKCFATHNKNLSIKIVTSEIGNKISEEEIYSFQKDNSHLEIKTSNLFHDRFLILDQTKLFHIGASLKDAGKKCFAIEEIKDQNYLKSLVSQIT